MGIPGREIVYWLCDRSVRERRDSGELSHKLSVMLLAVSAIDHPIANDD
jgi:hypothetical protein